MIVPDSTMIIPPRGPMPWPARKSPAPVTAACSAFRCRLCSECYGRGIDSARARWPSRLGQAENLHRLFGKEWLSAAKRACVSVGHRPKEENTMTRYIIRATRLRLALRLRPGSRNCGSDRRTSAPTLIINNFSRACRSIRLGLLPRFEFPPASRAFAGRCTEVPTVLE